MTESVLSMKLLVFWLLFNQSSFPELNPGWARASKEPLGIVVPEFLQAGYSFNSVTALRIMVKILSSTGYVTINIRELDHLHNS